MIGFNWRRLGEAKQSIIQPDLSEQVFCLGGRYANRSVPFSDIAGLGFDFGGYGAPEWDEVTQLWVARHDG